MVSVYNVRFRATMVSVDQVSFRATIVSVYNVRFRATSGITLKSYNKQFDIIRKNGPFYKKGRVHLNIVKITQNLIIEPL